MPLEHDKPAAKDIAADAYRILTHLERLVELILYAIFTLFAASGLLQLVSGGRRAVARMHAQAI
jgi:hypothetical protein